MGDLETRDDDPRRAIPVKNEKGEVFGHMIFCPACEEGHLFDQRWTFNGDYERPTFRASMLVHGTKTKSGEVYRPRCHSFVTDGRIQFLDDCEHDLAGRTVDLPSFGEV